MRGTPPKTTQVVLSAAQVVALTALLSGSTQKQAALQAGVTQRTMSRWVNEEGPFRQTLEQSLRDQAAARESLRAIATGEKHVSMARLRATLVVLGIDENDFRGDQNDPNKTSKAFRKLYGGPRLK